MKILIVIDYQNDFVTGPLGSPEAQAIMPNVIEKIKQYATDRSAAIVFTKDTHYADYMETAEGKKLPVPHCIAHTKGWDIVSDVLKAADPCETVEVFNKNTFGLYELPDYITDLAEEYFYNSEIESIEVIGVCTSICVISNVMILKSVFTETPITVDSQCCACVTPESHTAALNAMKMCQIDVI